MSQLSIFYPLIIGEDNPILRKSSVSLSTFDTEVEEFADVLLTLMYEYDGIGLAAPQLGHHFRMIAVTERKEEKGKRWKNTQGKKQGKVQRTLIGEYVMINPEILEHSITTQITEEACLSLPDIFGEVKRFQWIKVKYQNVQGKEIIKKLHGFNAVVVQHEIDHLNGILFTDKVIRFTKNS